MSTGRDSRIVVGSRWNDDVCDPRYNPQTVETIDGETLTVRTGNGEGRLRSVLDFSDRYRYLGPPSQPETEVLRAEEWERDPAKPRRWLRVGDVIQIINLFRVTEVTGDRYRLNDETCWYPQAGPQDHGLMRRRLPTPGEAGKAIPIAPEIRALFPGVDLDEQARVLATLPVAEKSPYGPQSFEFPVEEPKSRAPMRIPGSTESDFVGRTSRARIPDAVAGCRLGCQCRAHKPPREPYICPISDEDLLPDA